MKLVQLPGLPPYPKLYYDAAQQQAMISVRHPTWHSVERALFATEWVIITITVLHAWLLWRHLPYVGDMIVQVMLWCFTVSVAYSIAKFFLRRPLREFLARQMFPTRTTFWFSSQAVAFRSRLYNRPVLIWRYSGATPLLLRYIALPDVEASNYVDQQPPKRWLPKEHLSRSQLLAISIAGHDRRHGIAASYDNNFLRSLPVTEMDVYLATRLPMVCRAAAALTANPKPSNRDTGGIDIDADEIARQAP